MFQGLQHTSIASIITSFILTMIGFMLFSSVIGFCKALAAKIFGDSNAEVDHLLTLNPLVHADLLFIAPLTFGFICVSKLFSNSEIARIFTVILIAFLNSLIHLPQLVSNGPRNDKRIALINFCSLLVNFLLFVLPIPILMYVNALYPINDIALQVMFNLFVTLTTFAFIRLLVELPPIPPREGFLVVKPFLPYSVEKMLESVRENIFLTIVFAFATASLLLPLILSIFSIFTNVSSVILVYIKQTLLMLASGIYKLF